MNCHPRNPSKFSLVAGKTYAITLNPCDDSQAFDTRFTPEGRWAYVTSKFTKTLDCIRSFTFEIYFEVSTPDHLNRGIKTRIHAHGFINIHDLPLFLLTEINQLADWCDIKIKELTTEEGYRQYCMKQSDQLAALTPLYYSSMMIEQRIKAKKREEALLIKRRFGGSVLSID